MATEKTWEQKMAGMKFPPTGHEKRFLITCDGKPFAGYDTRKDAEMARDMYSKNVRGATNPSSNTKCTWVITEQ
jgi:hypothetical protein